MQPTIHIYSISYIYYSNNSTIQNTTINYRDCWDTSGYSQYNNKNHFTNYTHVSVDYINDTYNNIFGFKIHIWQYLNYTNGTDYITNTTANVTIIAYINASAIGHENEEVINFTVTGSLSTYLIDDGVEKYNNTAPINYSKSIKFNSSKPYQSEIIKYVTLRDNNQSFPDQHVQHYVKLGFDKNYITLSLRKCTYNETYTVNQSVKKVRGVKLKHIEPGRWIFVTQDSERTAVIVMYVYPQPIASGVKNVKVTFTRQ